MNENLRQLIFEACNDWAVAGMPVTTAIHAAFMESTGDRNKHPHALDSMARLALSFRPDASKATDDVLAERRRQIEAEGWTPEHDDLHHDGGNLAVAGAAYAINAADQMNPYSQGDGGNQQPSVWPWEPEWWKPKNPRRDLVRAAALLIAEIERLDC